ncbi:MAG: LacI family DNA-binding transcriptional regulator [Henriciella sp.]
MAELARLAGVDVSTVSRALNDSPLVKAKTKTEILKIAQETGYAVNASARNLRRRSSETIGMVIPLRPESGQTLSDPFFLEMVGAVSQAASERGYDLIINVPKEAEQIAEQRLLQTGKADGLVIIGQAGRSDRLDALGPLKNKVVVWGGRDASTKYTLVGSDNFEGGRLAADHLLSIGRKQILFIGPLTLPEVALRYEGYAAAHASRGLTLDPALKLDVEFGGHSVYHAMRSFMKQGHAFDAIFAASDVLAMTSIMALRSAGRSIPEDVSVVGYDNIGQAQLSTPPLTTIDQNIKEGGKMLVDLLLRQLAGEDVESHLTQTRLIVRDSSVAV